MARLVTCLSLEDCEQTGLHGNADAGIMNSMNVNLDTVDRGECMTSKTGIMITVSCLATNSTMNSSVELCDDQLKQAQPATELLYPSSLPS